MIKYIINPIKNKAIQIPHRISFLARMILVCLLINGGVIFSDSTGTFSEPKKSEKNWPNNLEMIQKLLENLAVAWVDSLSLVAETLSLAPESDHTGNVYLQDALIDALLKKRKNIYLYQQSASGIVSDSLTTSGLHLLNTNSKFFSSKLMFRIIELKTLYSQAIKNNWISSRTISREFYVKINIKLMNGSWILWQREVSHRIVDQVPYRSISRLEGELPFTRSELRVAKLENIIEPLFALTVLSGLVYIFVEKQR